jgi:hypothetical protein
MTQLPLAALDTPLGRAIGRAIADSYNGLRDGEEVLSSPDGETRVRVVYHPGGRPEITVLPR